MIAERVFSHGLGSANLGITIDRSRCLRMRFHENRCPVCISNCHAAAIAIADDIRIDPDKCTRCMLCVSECPADCFAVQADDFFSLLGRLRKMRIETAHPVLGCSTIPNAEAHAKLVCLGALSEEHLLALHTLLDRPLFLNATNCRQCSNTMIPDVIRERIMAIRRQTGIDLSLRITLAEDRSHLKFERPAYDRRGFFAAVKSMALLQASSLLQNTEPMDARPYSEKELPGKKELLNTVIRHTADCTTAERILRAYTFHVRAGTACDRCGACVGMCPTGALKISPSFKGKELLFNPSLCNGCGLCRDFCFKKAAMILPGYQGRDYCEHSACTVEMADAVSEHPA